MAATVDTRNKVQTYPRQRLQPYKKDCSSGLIAVTAESKDKNLSYSTI